MKMPILLHDELVELLTRTMDEEFTEASPEDQQKMIDSYRKVEKETNDQIEQAGSIKNWYESGRGRVIKTFEGFLNENESFRSGMQSVTTED